MKRETSEVKYTFDPDTDLTIVCVEYNRKINVINCPSTTADVLLIDFSSTWNIEYLRLTAECNKCLYLYSEAMFNLDWHLNDQQCWLNWSLLKEFSLKTIDKKIYSFSYKCYVEINIFHGTLIILKLFRSSVFDHCDLFCFIIFIFKYRIL